MEGYIPPEASHKCHTDTVILWILKNKTCALPAKHFWFQAAVGNICITSTSFTFFPTTVFQFKNIEILQSSATGSVSTVTRHWCRRTPVYCVAVMRVHSVEKGRLCWGWTSHPPPLHTHTPTQSHVSITSEDFASLTCHCSFTALSKLSFGISTVTNRVYCGCEMRHPPILSDMYAS